MKRSALFLLGLSFFIAPAFALAHEAYVLTPEEFSQGLAHSSPEAFGALKDSGNLKTFLIIAASVLVLLALNFWFRRTAAGRGLSGFLERFSRFGPVVVRLSIAASFFFSALSWSFLGPELPLSVLPYTALLRTALFAASFMLCAGLLTELAALAVLAIYSLAFWRFGLYLATYLNYLGELAVLLIFGSREFSIDRLVFGAKSRFENFKRYESTVVRVCYGLALIYAAVSIKLLHPLLTVTVVNKYNLTQFHWLFPHDPLLITLGAALSEMVIGLFIIFGFEMRLTIFISLIYITMSLLYFRELVWPHLLLYGISINLIINKETFTLDHFFDRKLAQKPAG